MPPLEKVRGHVPLTPVVPRSVHVYILYITGGIEYSIHVIFCASVMLPIGIVHCLQNTLRRIFQRNCTLGQ